MGDRVDTKRGMLAYAKKKGIGYKDLTGFRINNQWGAAAKGLAYRVSKVLHEKHPKVPVSSGCTARLTYALIRYMPIAAGLRIVYKYWYSHRESSRYSYPDHNEDRMEVGDFPSVAPWTDCSGMIRCMWKQLGWPDPAGASYGTWGNSDSFVTQAKAKGKIISRGSERLGDIACYSGGVGHAELIVGKGRVLTNGNEAGPYYRKLGEHSGTLTIVRLAPFV